MHWMIYVNRGMIVCLDWLFDPEAARQIVGSRRITLQGNLDPGVMYGTAALIEEKVEQMIKKFGVKNYIINFGHGTHPFMKPEKIEHF